MDHCLTPRNPVHPPLLVPVAFTEPYDNGPFLAYPRRQGWTEKDIFHDREENHIVPAGRRSGLEITGFIQQWLLLGLIAEIFYEPLEDGDFVQTVGGKQYLCTSALPERLARLRAREESASEETRNERARHVQRCLTRANTTLAQLAMTQHLYNHLCLKTLLAITFLFEYIDLYRYQIYGYPNAFHSQTKGVYTLILERMRADGWCPVELGFLRGRLTGHSLYFASMLERPSPELDHGGCTAEGCIARMVSEEEYITRHIERSCECGSVSIPPEAIYPVLRKGTLPLLLPQISEPLGRRFAIADFTEFGGTEDKYVAISHIWSDGRGNPRRNALPLCQMEKLTELVNKAYPSPGVVSIHDSAALWIDTICIPRGHKPGHDIAIGLMQKTFTEAGGILVLDSGLMSVKQEGMSDEEALLRVVCSAWSTRMWCLQEGWLAKRMKIQFADGAFDFAKAIFRISTTHVNGMPGGLVHTDILSAFAGFKTGPPMHTMMVPSVFSVSTTLRGRGTSVDQDEAVCLASLLSLDTMQVVRKQGAEERMADFWGMLEEIPQDIVFAHGEKLKIPGFRWAPASFLGAGMFGIPRRRADEGVGIKTERGLVVEYPGWIFDKALLEEDPEAARVFNFCDGPSWWTVRRVHPICFGPKTKDDTFEPIGYGLILHRPMPVVSHEPGKKEQNDPIFWDAIFVSIVASMSDFSVVFVRFEYNAFISLSAIHNSDEVTNYLVQSQSEMMGLPAPKTQKWCVD